MAWLAVFLVVLLAGQAQAAAKCQCALPIKKVQSTSSIKFILVGDWGRTGGLRSITNASMPGGLDTTGFCGTNFGGASAVADETRGAAGQMATAMGMEAVCKSKGCDFVINTGDNFYECGVEDPVRWKMDFEDVYQGKKTPTLKSLTWLNVLGNHDIVAKGSVEAQIAYHKKNSRWVMPGRYFAQEVHSKDGKLRLRFTLINTSPMVSKYAKAGTKYNTPEFLATSSPANLTEQLVFLEKHLNSSKATYDVVIGHHPLFGGAATVYGVEPAAAAGAGSADAGRPAADGKPSFASIVALLRKFKPVAYMNGHDHVMTHASDVNATYPTAYITSGAGSLPQGEDSCGAAARANVAFSNSASMPATNNCTAPAGEGVNGFALVTATSGSFKIDYYSVAVPSGKTTKVHSASLSNWNKARKPASGCAC